MWTRGRGSVECRPASAFLSRDGQGAETDPVHDIEVRGRRIATLLTRVRAQLPSGGQLPAQEWQRRHRGLVVFLWINLAAVVGLSVVFGRYGTVHMLEHAVAIGPLALMAS